MSETNAAEPQLTLNEWLGSLNDSWIDDWNEIVRNVLFDDPILIELMKVPDNIGIIEFIDRYFIRAGYTNKILKDESVRIVFGSVAVPTDTPNVTRNMMSFDIYVKNEDLHNIGKDRLVMRTHLIAKRLIELLTKNRYNGAYRFYDPHESDMGTSAIGYARYNMSISYMRTY